MSVCVIDDDDAPGFECSCPFACVDTNVVSVIVSVYMFVCVSIRGKVLEWRGGAAVGAYLWMEIRMNSHESQHNKQQTKKNRKKEKTHAQRLQQQ